MTPEEFRRRVVSSGLVTLEELDRVLEKLPAGSSAAVGGGAAQVLCQAGLLTPYQARQIAKGHGRRLVLGEYVILDRLGGGGMGEVFRARHRTMDREVALKVMKASMMEAPGAVERFRREVRAAAKLMHPNTVLAHDAGESGGVHYLVMEYVDGKDLESILRERGRFSVQGAVECLLQAARGLAYAHERGVIHRDIKPGNLLLSREGVVKILDLGLARLKPMEGAGTVGDRLTWTGQVMGTVDFMAPEQIRHPGQVDHRADIYALGCTLYRLLVGHSPYRGESVMEILLGHLERPVPPLREARPDAPEELEVVFQRMVAKRPEERYQSMGEVIGALEGVLARLGVVAKVGGAGQAEGIKDPGLRSFLGEKLPESVLLAETVRWEPEAVGEETEPEGAIPPVVAAAPGLPEWVRKRRERASLWSTLAERAKQLPLWGKIAAGVGVVVLVTGLVGAGIYLAGRLPVARQASVAGRTVSASKPGAKAAGVDRASAGPARVVILWAAGDRQEARLELDGKFVEVEKFVDPADPNRLVVEVAPGEHRVWLARRGYEPVEVLVAVAAGQETVLRPEWRPVMMPSQGVAEGEERPPEEMSTSQQEEPAVAQAGETPPPVEEKPSAAEEPAPQRSGLELAWEKLEGSLRDWEVRETEYLEKIGPVEELVHKWAFSQAAEEAAKIEFTDAELARRWQVRREELGWLAAWKARIAERIRTAQPRLQKGRLGLKGIGGELADADETGITCRLITGKEERLSWAEVGGQAARRLVALVVDQSKPEDLLQAAVFLASVGEGTEAARYFAQAREKGAEVRPHLELAGFELVRELVDRLRRREYQVAQAVFERLLREEGLADWRAEHAELVDGIAAILAEARREAEAEKLYAEAVKLYKDEELHDVKPLVEKLRSEYGNTGVVLDTKRQPSVAELAQATANLGRRIIVRQDGKGDFRTIQAAIDAAPASDTGPYSESVKVPDDKVGLRCRGRRGIYPLLVSQEPDSVVGPLLDVDAQAVWLERLIVVNNGAIGRTHKTVLIRKSGCVLRYSLVRSAPGSFQVDICPGNTISCCIFIPADPYSAGIGESTRVENCLFLGTMDGGPHTEIRNCVIKKAVITGRVSLANCIIGELGLVRREQGSRLEHCLVWGTASADVQRGPGCLERTDPLFRDPKNLDYRLMPGSPCIGKASDGGDIGVRWTPEMLEMIQVALELRRRGLISF